LERKTLTTRLARAALSLLVLAAAAVQATAGAAAPAGADKIWQKGKDTPLRGVITKESVEGIQIGGQVTIPIVSIARVDYYDAPDAYRRGHDRLQQGLYADAIKYFEAASRNQLARKFWLEPACLYYAGLAYLEDASDLAKAEAKFKELLEKHPKTRFLPDALLGIGRAQYKSGKYNAAIAQFKKLASLAEGKPGWESWLATAHVWQARSYLELKRFDDAQRSVRRALDAAPDPKSDMAIQARTVQAMVLLKQDKPKEAIALLNELLQTIAPRVADEVDKGASEVRMQRTESQCQNALGRAYLQLYAKSKKEEDLRSALLAFLWTVVLYPRSQFAAEHAEALYSAAQCFQKLKQRRRATDLLNELSEKYPDSPYTRMLSAGKASTSRKEKGK